jgi:ABC-2 type transport system permease protein
VAVYERTYRRYDGELTADRSRVMVLPRYAYEEILRSKMFLVFIVLCLVWSFGLACLLYIPHNLGLLNIEAFDLDPDEVGRFFASLIDAGFFYKFFMIPTFFMALVITIVVGPVLITSDLRNNGLALYFSRPIRRSEYALGKGLVLAILLSIVTWIPGLLLFLFQSYLEGFDWMTQNYRVGLGIAVGHWIWITVLCLVSLAISAYVKWKPVARLVLLLLIFVAGGLAALTNFVLQTDWASVINITDMIMVIWSSLFGLKPTVSTPVWVAWLSPILFCGVSVWLLSRKLQPYEIVK